MSNLLSATLVELTPLAKGVFGDENIQQMKKKGLKTVRKIWELSTPTTQCHQTIGKCDLNHPCVCYICGYDIQTDKSGMVESEDDDETGDVVNPEEEFYPECEHVLPIAQAMIFLDLYIDSYKRGDIPIPPAHKKALELEYKWAHKICNRAKSDISFITTKNDKWIPNEEVISDLLEVIYKKSTKIPEEVKSQRLSKKDWKKRQITDIVNHIDQIIRHILAREDGTMEPNTNVHEMKPQYELQNLVLLAGVSSLFDREHHSPIVDKIIPEVISRYKTIATRSTVNFKQDFEKLLETTSEIVKRIHMVLEDRKSELGKSGKYRKNELSELSKLGNYRKYQEYYERTLTFINDKKKILNIFEYAQRMYLKLLLSNTGSAFNKNQILPFIIENIQCKLYFDIIKYNEKIQNNDNAFIQSKINEILNLWKLREDRKQMLIEVSAIDNSFLKDKFMNITSLRPTEYKETGMAISQRSKEIKEKIHTSKPKMKRKLTSEISAKVSSIRRSLSSSRRTTSHRRLSSSSAARTKKRRIL
jgi:hypothetical protein